MISRQRADDEAEKEDSSGDIEGDQDEEAGNQGESRPPFQDPLLTISRS